LKKRHLLVVAVAGGIVAASGGAAYAYWSTSGSGSGSGGTANGATAAIAITDDSSSLSAMFPGDSAQTVTVTATNSDSQQSAYVNGVSAYLTVTEADNAPAGTCDASDYLLNGASGVDSSNPASLNWTPADLAAGATASTTFTLQFNNKDSVQDACQGASVAITYASN
jgi:hypothetical protein